MASHRGVPFLANANDVGEKDCKYLSHLNRPSMHDTFCIGQLVQDLEFGVDPTQERVDHCADECEEAEVGISSELLEMPAVTNYQLVCIAAGVPTLELIQ